MGSSKESTKCVVHRRNPRFCKPLGQKDRYQCMFSLIESWLGQCLENHFVCSASLLPATQSTIVPTRLIDVGRAGISQEPRLVKYSNREELLEATKSARYPGYATLSYCWGEQCDTAFLLRRSNEARLLQALPLASLPRTIKDAVEVCRRIGIQCLWVDALCILQDKNDSGGSRDWQAESGRVGAYYNNSLVTIAAAWASNNDVGCLPCRDFYHSRSQIEAYAKSIRDTISIAASLKQPGLLKHIDGRRFREHERSLAEISDSSLLTRGWVVQEIAFSPRVLWLTDTGVFWRCRWISRTDRGKRSPPRAERIVSLPTEPRHLQWYSIIEQYSRMALLRIEDRLPALSGLCKYFDPHQKDAYLAGIWGSSLMTGLSWYGPYGEHGYDTDTFKTQMIEDTPSWSWISRNRPVRFCDLDVYACLRIKCPIPDPCVVLLDTNIRLSYPDPHGQVSFASLRVKVQMQKLTFEARSKDCDGMQWMVYNQEVKGSTEYSFASRISLNLDHTGVRHSLDRTWTGVLVLLHHKCNGSACFLILEAVEGHYTAYHRVGLMVVGAFFYHNTRLTEVWTDYFGHGSTREITLL
jgi:hypothetical protein